MSRVHKLIAGTMATLFSASAWGAVATQETWGLVESQRPGQLTLQTSSGPRTLIVPSGSLDVRDVRGQPATLDALAHGDWLRVHYVPEAPGSSRERDHLRDVQILSHAP